MKMQRKETGKARKNFFLVVFTAAVFLLSIIPLAEAQEKTLAEAQKLLDTSKRFRVGLSLFVGGGTDKIDVGETTTGETISISGGGGNGGAIILGYDLSSKLDIDLTAGTQQSLLSPPVVNAAGSFDRKLLLATLRYKIPFSHTGQFKVGGGIGYYSSGELDIDASQIPGGGHNIYKYDDATGFHITAEFESSFSPNWSWMIGAKYCNVSYDVKSCTSNGVSIPVTFLTDEVRSVDGSGFDLIIAMARYF